MMMNNYGSYFDDHQQVSKDSTGRRQLRTTAKQEFIPEPSPINTGRMRIVDKLDLGSPELSSAGSSNLNPFSRNYRLTQSLPLSIDESIPLPTEISHYNPDDDGSSRARRLLASTMRLIRREDTKTNQHHSYCPGDVFQQHAKMENNHPKVIASAYTTSSTTATDLNFEEANSEDDSKAQTSSDVTDRWHQKFSELCAFIQKHGHARVPVRYEQNMSLSKWAKRQRYQRKLKYEGKYSTVTDKREQALNDVGFLWDIRLTVWEERFEELVEFKKIYGHCNVPISCQKFLKLGTWVKCQRRQWKLRCNGQPSSISTDRIAKLEAIGFSWEAR